MVKRKITCLLVVLCISTIALAASSWSDEFDSWNSANWNIQTGGGGWGNAELQTYTTGAVTVSGGQLIITATKPTSTTFESGRINTSGKRPFRFGTLEAQITIPNLANGLWPGFWSLGTVGGWPNCGEIDVMEMGGAAAIAAGKVNQRVWGACAWESGGGYAGYALTSDSGGGTMTNKLDWTSSLVRIYLNGGQIFAMDVSSAGCPDCEEFRDWDFYVLLNMAVGGYFPGITTASGITAPFPAQLKVNYVRYVAAGGTTSTTTTASSTTTTATSTTTTATSTTTTATSTSTTATSTSTTASGVVTIQAENWSAMSGVATEACSEGGLNVGWIDTGDWMAYNVTISTAKSYLFKFRVASPNSGRILSVDYNGGAVVVGQATIPNTGGWQIWQTCTMSGNLPSGSISLGIYAVSGGWNINWFSYE